METSFIYARRRKMKYLLFASRLSLALSSRVWQDACGYHISLTPVAYFTNTLNYNKLRYNSNYPTAKCLGDFYPSVILHRTRDLTPH